MPGAEAYEPWTSGFKKAQMSGVRNGVFTGPYNGSKDIAAQNHNTSWEFSYVSQSLPVGPPAANLLRSLQTQRPEVEVRTAKAFLTPVNIWSFAHARQHTQFFT